MSVRVVGHDESAQMPTGARRYPAGRGEVCAAPRTNRTATPDPGERTSAAGAREAYRHGTGDEMAERRPAMLPYYLPIGS
jgi:hypothetical protein